MANGNVVFFHAESWDGRMLGQMGHPALRDATPHLDRIAGQGTAFDQAYCSHPICCPSRANLWSGRYTHHCESWNNYKGLEPGMWSLLDDLPRSHAFASFGKLDYRSGGHTICARLGAWLTPLGLPRPIFDNSGAHEVSVDPDRNPRFHEADWEKVDRACAFLRQQRGSDQPFFLYVSTSLVHPAFRTNRYWLDRIPADAVDLPPADGTTHPARLHQRMAKGVDGSMDDAAIRQMRRVYFAMCAEADAMVGAVYDTLSELGLAKDTQFIFSSDHGELAMEHGEWYKMSLYEGSVRVPLILAGPGIQAGRRIPQPVSLIDLCPTLMDLAGLPARPGLDGESLLPLATGATRESRGWAYAVFTGVTMNTSCCMLRKDRWKWNTFHGYPSQLFDMERDPGELQDVSESHPEAAAEMDRLLNTIVDRKQMHRDWEDYCRESFRQWRRQAKRGLYVDDSYGLRNRPSSDYWEIMRNCFTGYGEEDEARVQRWLDG